MATQEVDIRVLVLDIDGTIAGESNEVRAAVKQAIRAVQAKGIGVAIATGRMYCSALRFFQSVEANLPLIAYNGAWIQDPKTGQRLWHVPVPRTAAQELLDYFEQPALRSLLSVHFYIDDQLYVRQLTPETQLYAERSGVIPIPVGDLRSVLDNEPTKVLALCDEIETMSRLLGQLRRRYTPAELYLTQSVSTFFEACHPRVNKGTAVRYLVEKVLRLQAKHVMAIGDNFNDLEMLTYARIGVAMGNAPLAVQQAADWIAPSVEADGVTATLERFLL